LLAAHNSDVGGRIGHMGDAPWATRAHDEEQCADDHSRRGSEEREHEEKVECALDHDSLQEKVMFAGV
jgi:hypothetical protein